MRSIDLALLVLRNAVVCLGLTAATVRAPAQERHLGAPEEALVGVEVSQPDGSRTLYSLGFLIRCDGFVLVPDHVFSQRATEAGKRSVSVVMNPGTPRERRVVGMLPRATREDVPYNIFRIPRTHAPALRAHLSDGLKPGDLITLCWSERDSAAGKYGAAQRRTAHIGEAILTRGVPLEFRIQEALDEVPLGALVLGPDDQLIGIVAERKAGGGTLRFRTFESLEMVTDLAGASPMLLTSADSAAGAAPVEAAPETSTGAAAARSGGMVKVPGGRVRMPAGLMRGALQLEGEPDVCVPEFEIDELEVTNQEYLAFLQALPAAKRDAKGFMSRYYPLGWATDGPPFPRRLEKMPVIGVSYDCASEYARWRGKRLPTPYEWVRAATGESGDPSRTPWVKEYLADTRRVYASVSQAHARYLAQDPELRYRELLARVRPEPTESPANELARRQRSWEEKSVAGFLLSGGIPWVPTVSTQWPLIDFSREVMTAAYRELVSKWTAPKSLREVGAREFDVSPFGARDMILNAGEWVLGTGLDLAGDNHPYVRLYWRDVPLNRAGQDFIPTVLPDLTAYSSLLERRTSGAGTAIVNLSTRGGAAGPALEVLRFFHTVGEVNKELMPLAGGEFAYSDLRTMTVWLRADPSGREGLPDSVEDWVNSYAVKSWRFADMLREREIGLPEPEVRVSTPPTRPYSTTVNRNQVPGTSGKWQLTYEWQIMPVGFRCAR